MTSPDQMLDEPKVRDELLADAENVWPPEPGRALTSPARFRPGERAMAVLSGRRRVLRHTTMSPSEIGMIVQAAPALTNSEKLTR